MATTRKDLSQKLRERKGKAKASFSNFDQPLRSTDHPNIKNTSFEKNDLWAIAGHHLIHDKCKEILKDAYNDKNLPLGCLKLHKEYKKTKRNGSSYRKNELLARILCLYTTRVLCLEKLKELKAVEDSAVLSDFYLQFCEDGEKFPGDSPDSNELKLSAKVQIISESISNEGSSVSINVSLSEDKTPALEFLETNLLSKIREVDDVFFKKEILSLLRSSKFSKLLTEL